MVCQKCLGKAHKHCHCSFFSVFTLLHKQLYLSELVPRLPCMHQVCEVVGACFLCKSMNLGSEAGLVVQLHLA